MDDYTDLESIKRIEQKEAELAQLKAENEAILKNQQQRKQLNLPVDETPYEGNNYARYGARAARDVAAAAGDLVDLPFMVAEGARWLGQKGLKAAGAPVNDPTFGEYLPNIGEKIARGIDTATGGYTAPRTKGEKLAEAGTRALAQLPFGLGAAGTAAKYLPKVAPFLQKMHALTPANIGATAGSSVASQAYVNANPDSVGGALVAGLAGGMGGQKTAKTIQNITRHGVNNSLANRTGKILGINAEKGEALSDLPVSLADLTDNKFVQSLQHKMGWLPGSSGRINKFYKKQGEHIREMIGLGDNPMNEESAGKLIHKTAERAKNAHTAKVKPLIEKYEKGLTGSNKFLIPTESASFNQEIASPYYSPTAQNTSKNTKASRIANKINSSIAETEIEHLLEAVKTRKDKNYKGLKEELAKRKGEISFNDLNLYKKEAGEAGSNVFGLVSTVPKGNVKLLYGKIKKDLDKHIGKIGGETEQAWHDFNTIEANYQKNVKPHINDINKEAETSLGKVFFNTILSATNKSASPRRLRNIYNQLSPTNRSELFESMVHEMGRTSDGGWNALKAKRQFDSMRRTQQSVFLEALPTDAARLDFRKTMKAIGVMNEKSAALNTSGSAHHLEATKYANEVKNQVTQAVALIGTGAAAANFPQVAAGVMAAILGPIGGSQLFTNQRLLKWAAKGMSAKNQTDFIKNLNKVPEFKGRYQAITAASKSIAKNISEQEENKRAMQRGTQPGKSGANKRLYIEIRPPQAPYAR